MSGKASLRGLLAAAIVCCAVVAQADVFNMGGTRDPATGTWTGSASLEFVTVGDPGNAPDTAVMHNPDDASTGYGSVGYTYQIGKYSVTVGQYTAFLNAVAKTDAYGLYVVGSGGMALGTYPTIGITQSGIPGNYSYSVAGSDPQAANCPIWCSWGDAARFCNWLQNGQPTGAEGAGTTETGAYTLNGDTTDLMTETRNAGAKYFIPSEDEWYKAAYYKGGSANAGYWIYPTQSNTAPSSSLPDAGNSANWSYADPTDWLTPVGAFAASPGPYGTYDMGGENNQWNEAIIPEDLGIHISGRGVRGGWFECSVNGLSSGDRAAEGPVSWTGGFRVASVPEPGSLAMLVGIAFTALLLWRKRG